MQRRNASLDILAVIVLMAGFFALKAGLRTAGPTSISGYPVTPSRPTPLPSPVVEFSLQPGEERPFIRPGGSAFELDARIDFKTPKGAAYLLAISVDGKQIGSLVNKSDFFRYADNESFLP